MIKKDFISALASLRPSSTFLSVLGYKNASNEVANFNLVFNISYENALKNAVKTISEYKPIDELETQAKEELLASWNKTLNKTGSEKDEDPTYQFITDENGKAVKGIKIHKETGELYLYGLQVSKNVLKPGTYKEVKSKPLTIAKNKLTGLTQLSKFRMFKLNPDQVDMISVGNMTLSAPL